MRLGMSVAIFDNINSNDYSDEEKVQMKKKDLQYMTF